MEGIKILAVGAATQDVFLTGSAFKAKRDVRARDYVEQFPLGAKIEVDQVLYDTGGGAANAAVTFARQGLEAVVAAKVGHDPAGAEIIRVLRRESVNTDYVTYDRQLGTGYSTFLLAPSGERTILVYRGASHNLQVDDFPIKNWRADWIYVTSLAGNLKLLKKILQHANTHGMGVAFTPGQLELSQAKKLRSLLPLVTVLLANRQEFGQLFNGTNERDLVLTAGRMCRYAVLTDGPHGSFATDGEKFYQAGQYQKVKVIDRTGAGDAFGSGFVAALAKGLSIEDAITLGSANSSAVVQKIGAKAGILKSTHLKRMKMKVSSL